MRIPDKQTMYALYEQGAFGNKLRTWRYGDAWPRDLEYSLRTAVQAGGLTIYRVPGDAVSAVVRAWERQHRIAPEFVRLNESAPDQALTLQGEVVRGPWGLDLTYNTTPGLTMRDALLCAQHAQGLRAHALLATCLWPSSLDDVQDLLDLYPGAVVEFSAYRRAVGDRRGRNTLVWEVRHY